MKLEQKDVAQQIGVTECSVFNWEANASQPDLRYVPAVIQFLAIIHCAGSEDDRRAVAAVQDLPSE